jgi:DNA repair protein RecO (recombination protein O)
VLKIEQQPAYLLHSRPYRETSRLADLLTRDHGRVSVVVKGQRRRSNKRSPGLLQPFIPLLVNWSGRSSLKTLIAYENETTSRFLEGERLYSALYCNELLTKLLMPHDQHPGLYQSYDSLLISLSANNDIEQSLRLFELKLLEILGYGIDLVYDANQQEIVPEGRYWFDPESGFLPDEGQNNLVYSGEVLGKIAQRNFEDQLTKRAAKTLMRGMIDHVLAGKSILARDLFRRT